MVRVDGESLEGTVSFLPDVVTVRGSGRGQDVPLKDVRAVVLRKPQDSAPNAPGRPDGSVGPDGSKVVGGPNIAPSDELTADGSPTREWRSIDIGKAMSAGQSSWEPDGKLKVNASGWGLGSRGDSIHFTFVGVTGDGQLVARADGPKVGGLMAGQAPAAVQFGITYRAGVTADASHISLIAGVDGVVRFNQRPAEADGAGLGAAVDASGRWLRLARHGDTFTGYSSTDGQYWSPLGSRVCKMPESVYAGIIAGTRRNTAPVDFYFSRPVVSQGVPEASFFAGSILPPRGIYLMDGSVLAGRVTAVDSTHAVLVRGAANAEHRVALERVAAILFNPAPRSWLGGWQAEPEPAALMLSGDQFSGSFDRLAPDGSVALSSVIFGPRTFDAAKELIAVRLAAPTIVSEGWFVRLADGSLIRTAEVKLGKDSVSFRHPIDGPVEYPRDGIKEVRRVDTLPRVAP